MGVDTFNQQAAERLDGPDWLRTRRLAAAGGALQLPLPTPDAEEWRYSRIAELDLGAYGLVDGDRGAGIAPAAAAVLAELGEQGDPAAVVVLRNGVVVHREVSDPLSAAGVTVGPLDGPDSGADSGAAAALGAAMPDPVDTFAAYNDAFSADPVLVDVPRGTDVEGPVVVVSHVDAEGAAVFPRLVVRAGENSSVSVIEVSVSDDVAALVAPVTELVVGAAARVRHGLLQDQGPRVWHLGSVVARVGQDATLEVGAATLGADYGRLRLDCHLVGRGATGNLSAVYFGDDAQMLDLRTFQEHAAADTTSNLLFKGAVADTSHSVYTGMIRIRPGARGSNAFQTNRNIKLSEHAWAESVPNLEIENNDVRCSHASTVGPVDEEQRFYLESRGVPTEAAERLIVGGFFDEVLDGFAVPALGPAVQRRLDELLDRQVGRAERGDRPGDGSASSPEAGR